MLGKAKQKKEAVGRARQGRRRQGKQSKSRSGKTRQGTEGEAWPGDPECLSLGSKRYSASIGRADVKVPWEGIVQQDWAPSV